MTSRADYYCPTHSFIRLCCDHMERLESQAWFLGDLSQDVASTVVSSSSDDNIFLMYRENGTFKLCARIKPLGKKDVSIQHFSVTEKDAKFYIVGQLKTFDSVLLAVNHFVSTYTPPLRPILDTQHSQTSLTDLLPPPKYEMAQRVLHPDIAPLPYVGDIHTVSAVGRPTESIYQPLIAEHANLPQMVQYNDAGSLPQRIWDWLEPPQDYNDYGTSQWRHYPYHHRCHPRNICYGCCCYGSRHDPDCNCWFMPFYKGPFRALLSVLFWAVVTFTYLPGVVGMFCFCLCLLDCICSCGFR